MRKVWNWIRSLFVRVSAVDPAPVVVFYKCGNCGRGTGSFAKTGSNPTTLFAPSVVGTSRSMVVWTCRPRSSQRLRNGVREGQELFQKR